MFRFSALFCTFCVVIMIIMSGCGSQPTQVVQALQPVSCHRELFVGILYILVKNDGTDTGTSSLHVSYTIDKKKQVPVNIQINLPFIPAHGQRLVMVNMPSAMPGAIAATDATHFKYPTSRIVLQFSNKSGGVGQKESTFFSDCTDQ